MNLYKQLLTENDCYKAGRTIVPKGVMVHSTGANNPWVCRYVPGNDALGYNTGGNHWNRAGFSKCVHAFVGKLADGTVGTVQTLPWTMRGWHAGGAANNTHIGFEICEDGLEDSGYFQTVYREAVELTAFLCREYALDPGADGVVICHSEGYKRGVASNHADVMHWFPMHGKTMDDFRADVARALEGEEKVTYEEWKAYMERYRRELAGQEPTMPELVADAAAMGLTDGTRPRDLVTREECAVMARAAAKTPR
ncbi:amidase [Pseudoflavonifractor sp. AF19-9AC]|uniref:peptidoglycan recognition protein family protein n=1 Tax=Pseudoflavonifractor sp. AF19-9AC TaxID=2292244 RepID=UPI000E50ACF5|nr:peptidoglycan recognition family protein [Pseudoflavonifractor sp. AF19-9AC]RHR05592.1 amidase [Pseudoflavonifractor sp. AF19-9AC]